MPTPIPVNQPDLYQHAGEIRVFNRPERGTPSLLIIVDHRSDDADDKLVTEKADRKTVTFDPDNPKHVTLRAALEAVVLEELQK